MARNRIGQYTGEGNLELKISKKLQAVADEVAIRVRPLVRDELERTHIFNVYDSYRPATQKGRAIEEYNKTHKHQKPRLYHHTGNTGESSNLASSIYAVIDGDTVIAKVRDKSYPDGTSTTKVYDILKYGTPKTSKKKGFYYNNHSEFSTYISQPPHNFEARTREDMKIFLNDLAKDLKNHPEKYIDKYLNKRV